VYDINVRMEASMARKVLTMRHGEGESLRVMGADVKFLCTADSTDRTWSLMEVTLPPDAGPPPHTHPWDEAYYVIEGEVRFSLEGQERVVRGGDFIYAPGGTLHGFQGVSRPAARVLIFDAPAHAESFFREVEREVKGPQDMAKVPEIGLRHQIDFARP
jgi:quercetin dioxygenase-like cupin family protein